MSIPAGIVRVVFKGHLQSAEIFETGYWYLGTAADQASAQAVANSTATNFLADALAVSLASLLFTDSGYDSVTLYFYTTGSSAATFVATAPCALVGTGTNNLPFQAAVVATLLTGAAGRSNRGRMYFPADGVSLTAHQMADTITGNISSRLAGYFTAHYPTPNQAQVLSQTRGSSRSITSVRCDSKLDIQRRRANKQTPAFTHTTSV